VKECFVLSDKAKALANRNTAAFQGGLVALKKNVRGMSDRQLDSVLGWRAQVYDALTWSWGAVSIDEIGVWPGAAGLPCELCLGSVRETALGILNMGGVEALPVGADNRAKENILGIMKVAEVISKERLLSVIVEVGGKHRETPPHKRMQWDLNDGSVRSVAFALVRIDRLNAFFGI
jgi:hypothetical protein